MRLDLTDTTANLRDRRKSRGKRRMLDPSRTPLEHEEQANLVTWAYVRKNEIPALGLLFAIPNQGAARLKNLQTEGVMKGVPDLFLAVMAYSGPESQYGGLFIELKRTKGAKVSPEQYEWIGRLTAQGYKCVVARGCEEAKREILEYLGETE